MKSGSFRASCLCPKPLKAGKDKALMEQALAVSLFWGCPHSPDPPTCMLSIHWPELSWMEFTYQPRMRPFKVGFGGPNNS